MFDHKKAAEYFVVAWVKDWTLRTYLAAISEGEMVAWGDAHKHFPWLPDNESPFIRDTRVRRWAADAMRSINDRLWGAADNAGKLKVAPMIERLNAAGRKMGANKARAGLVKEQKALAASTVLNNISIEEMRRGGGAHWSTCK